jgi:hypothetical protein
MRKSIGALLIAGLVTMLPLPANGQIGGQVLHP